MVLWRSYDHKETSWGDVDIYNHKGTAWGYVNVHAMRFFEVNTHFCARYIIIFSGVEPHVHVHISYNCYTYQRYFPWSARWNLHAGKALERAPGRSVHDRAKSYERAARPYFDALVEKLHLTVHISAIKKINRKHDPLTFRLFSGLHFHCGVTFSICFRQLMSVTIHHNLAGRVFAKQYMHR